MVSRNVLTCRLVTAKSSRARRMSQACDKAERACAALEPTQLAGSHMQPSTNTPRARYVLMVPVCTRYPTLATWNGARGGE